MRANAFTNNSNEANIKNVRKHLLDTPHKIFGMCVRETTRQAVSVEITKESRKICANDLCRIK